MGRRGSTGRLMVATGLSACLMAVLRGWLGPENFLGFCGPIAVLVLLGMIGWILFAGQAGRFFAGVVGSGVVVIAGILIAPASINRFSLEKFIAPVERLIFLKPGSGVFDSIELKLFDAEVGIDPRGHRISDRRGVFDRMTHRDFKLYNDFFEIRSADFQALLSTPQVILAILGGLVVAVFPKRLAASPSPLDSS